MSGVGINMEVSLIIRLSHHLIYHNRVLGRDNNITISIHSEDWYL